LTRTTFSNAKSKTFNPWGGKCPYWSVALVGFCLGLLSGIGMILLTAQTKNTACRFASDGIERILATHYENVTESVFPLEHIDVDGDGKSTLETLQYMIIEDQPFPGLKTVKTTVSWPEKPRQNYHHSNKPILNQREYTLIISEIQST
jgi:hypothetical protein